jgi:signal peptidase I
LEVIDGKVYIDGGAGPLRDEFVSEIPRGDFGPFEIPEGCYFMMGDNRNNSYDSRRWKNAFVERDAILGKAAVVYFPNPRVLEDID